MNRREFWMSAGGATALTVLSRSALFAAEGPDEETTPFFLRGLAMVSFGDADYLRIALPKAPHHVATLGAVSLDGSKLEETLKGHGTLRGVGTAGVRPEIKLPALVDVHELYKDAVSKIDSSPTIISIPWSAVRSVATETVTEDRWTFVWKESGEEVISFRPRKIAESLRIDLSSSGTLEVNDGKKSIELDQVQEISTDFVPDHGEMGNFTDHFHYYTPYFDTAVKAQVEPRQVGRPTNRTVTPALGNAFTGARLWPFYACFPFRVDSAR